MPQAQVLELPSDGPVDFGRGSVYFVGTATVIIRYAGMTILTDPNFLHKGDHVHLGYGLKSERVTNPAIDIEQLPPLDLVVLSHLHEDHFDRIAEQKLDKSVPILTTRHAATRLSRKGFTKTLGLDHWESFEVRKGDARLRLTSTPAKHAPGILNALLPPVMGSLLEFQESERTTYRIYISGDTLLFDELARIPERFDQIDLALLHLGGTMVFGLMLTMDGEQGVRALQIIAPQLAIPIHYSDYTVFKSPLSDFVEAVRAAGLTDKVRYLKHGETYQFEVRA